MCCVGPLPCDQERDPCAVDKLLTYVFVLPCNACGGQVRTLREELDGLATLPTQDVQRKEAQLAGAALLPCKALANGELYAEMTPLAQQALLGAAAAAAVSFGRVQPEAVLAAVPAALAAATSELPALRGSALVLLSTATKAVGVRLLPHLPATVKAVLASGAAAAATLAKAHGSDATAAAPAAPAPTPVKAGKAGKEGKGVAAAAQSAEAAAAFDEDGERSPTEAAAVEATAALAALAALVDSLGAFLSPYLKDMLALLLHPGLLPQHGTAASGSTMVAAAVAAGAGVRASVPSVIPMRLLLEPLFAQLPTSLGAGISSTTALLQMVTAATESMDTKTAATYNEQVFLFLIRLLDVRTLAPPALANHIHEAEAATTKALVALVMKLTETRFKPLFLRMVEWASTEAAAAYDEGPAPAGGAAAGAGAVGRQIALFGVSAALTQRLRSVFVPYFRYLLDKAVRHLGGAAVAASGPGAQPAKKKRKASLSGGDGDVAAAGDDEASWTLRLRVVRALHRALLHDSVSFFDGEKLERLLHPLVAQLEAQPPAGPIARALRTHGSDPELDSYVSPPASGKRSGAASALAETRHEAYDTYGVATVACLVQMGVTANTDVFWKPLNRAVLMVTRSSSVRSRLLAVEVVAQLVSRLREEYLVLLPEVRGSERGAVQGLRETANQGWLLLAVHKGTAKGGFRCCRMATGVEA